MWRQARRKGAERRRFRQAARCAHGRRPAHQAALHARRCSARCSRAAMPGAAPFTRGPDAPADGLRLADPSARRRGRCRRWRTSADPGGAGRRSRRRRARRSPAPGQIGAKIANAADMAAALDGVHLDFAPVALAGGIDGLKDRARISCKRSQRSRPSRARPSRASTSTRSARSRASAPAAGPLDDGARRYGASSPAKPRKRGATLTAVLVDATDPARGRRQRGARARLSRRCARRLLARLRVGRRHARRRLRDNRLRACGRH